MPLLTVSGPGKAKGLRRVPVVHIKNCQHFIRIGKTPIWSLEAAQDRAKKLRSILNQGDDPARYQKQNNVTPVENLIQYIAEQLRTNP
jgi:hypothetical protein